jgi:2-hydroxychromene-2-carboxylate isomerase
MHTIEFWFDFSSPYSYFAALQIEEVAERHGRVVEWHPFLLGAAFQVTGMQSLSNTPLRSEYARHDWQRLSRKLAAPFKLPPTHPATSLAAGRAFYWLSSNCPAAAVPFAKAVFHDYFGEGIDNSGSEVVVRMAGEAGADSDALAVALGSQSLKERFREVGMDAIARGVFGAPFFFIDGEPFWGSDRLSMMDDWLGRSGW